MVTEQWTINKTAYIYYLKKNILKKNTSKGKHVISLNFNQATCNGDKFTEIFKIINPPDIYQSVRIKSLID